MSEAALFLVAIIAGMLTVLCLIALRIAFALETLKVHITLENHHTVTIERDDDNGDESEAWKN